MTKFILTLPFVLLLTACSDDSLISEPLSKSEVILTFGDSLTYGYGAGSLENSYPSKLEDITGYSVINAGINGDTAKAAGNRIDDLINKHSPSLVLIGLGGNDMLRKNDKNLKEDLNSIINQFKSNNIKVVLLAMPKPQLNLMGQRLSDYELYNEIANENDVFLIENTFSKYLSNNSYKSDMIHLNAEGYGLVAKDIAEVLEEKGFIKYSK